MTYISFKIYIFLLSYIYINIWSGHKWLTTCRVLVSYKSKMSIVIIYSQSWKRCALSVEITMDLYPLSVLYIFAQMHELWQSHCRCDDNLAGTLFSWLHIYVYAIMQRAQISQKEDERNSCMSCYKVIVVITGRAYVFHNCISIYIYR